MRATASYLRRLTEAATNAATKAARQPERALFLGAAGINIVTSALGWETPRKATKVMLVPALAGSVIRARREATISDRTTGELLAGLAGGFGGDVILLPRHNNLNHGAVSFVLNHLAYHVLLVRAGARPTRKTALPRAAAWAGGSLLTALLKPRYLPAGAGYGLALGTTAVLANDPTLRTGGTQGLGPAADIFFASDALLMLRAIVGESTTAGKLLDAGVMTTYSLAQLLLVDGLIAAHRKEK